MKEIIHDSENEDENESNQIPLAICPSFNETDDDRM